MACRTLPEQGWNRRFLWALRGGPGGPTGGGQPSSPRRSGPEGRPSDGGGSVLPHPVRLRVAGGGLVVLNVEQAAEGGPQGGGELGPAV